MMRLMLNPGGLTFREFAMREPLPLAAVHEVILQFVRGREDVVVFGATAVNAYVSEPRMTEDIDMMSTRAAELSQELRQYLTDRLRIAIRVRVIGKGKGYRLFQVQKPKNRHLADVRPVQSLPESKTIAKVKVPTPPTLIAQKVISYHARQGQPKGFSDRRDLAALLLTFPELRGESGPVVDALKALGANPAALSTWRQVAAAKIPPVDEDAEFD
jgi:hypothetical protein